MLVPASGAELSEEESIGHRSHDIAGHEIACRIPRHERHPDPQSLHHSDDPVPDRLQHLSADLFARLFLYRLPCLVERAGQFRRPAELPRAAQRPLHLVELRHHREICDRLCDGAGDRRLRHRDAAQPRHSVQGSADDAAAAADDAVDGGGRPLLEAALRPVLWHHQLRARPRLVSSGCRIPTWRSTPSRSPTSGCGRPS